MLDRIEIKTEKNIRMTEKIQIRVSVKMKNRYKLLANIYGLTLSDFMRTRPDIAYESILSAQVGQKITLTKDHIKDIARKLQKPPRISKKVKFASVGNTDMEMVQKELKSILEKRRIKLDKQLDEIDEADIE